MAFPRMARVRQKFHAPKIDDIPAEVESQMAALNLGEKVHSGQTIAITAGSRGIANIALIIKSICDHVKSVGGVPIIVPAMGSHGGGTAEGQRAIIEGYGVTEEFTGAEIRASMETVVVDETSHGIPVHFDKVAFECDHVIVCGRVKPHTSFVGPIESGLHKMMLIGLGKHAGAKIYHRAILDYSFTEIIQAVAESVLRKCDILCGVAIVENAYDETRTIEAVAPGNFYERECELLKLSVEAMPKLPFDSVQLLIIDEIGKNISGSGMDTNIIGRKYNDHAATEKDKVKVRRIFVRGLTEATHGNACGLGMAEFTNTRTAQAVDKKITAINSLTGGHPSAAGIPCHFDSDREVIENALATVGFVEPENARVVQIADTLHLGEVLVSEACLAEVADRDDLEVIDGPFEMPFDENGNLAAVGIGH
ncbi:MAG: lactate racemase domain-containing protein [Planctomycetota bacterium]|nr:lactate racemase domain-containing protein [Planctomycetota bacterium]MDA1248756.1 lactate racemase domain-containing protein [Planctomycetota bacterium]